MTAVKTLECPTLLTPYTEAHKPPTQSRVSYVAISVITASVGALSLHMGAMSAQALLVGGAGLFVLTCVVRVVQYIRTPTVNIFENIINFTNHYNALSPAFKKTFLDQLVKYFSDLAYTDQTLTLPADRIELFSEYDLQSLSNAMEEVDYPHRDTAFRQLVANIAKVTRRDLTPPVIMENIYPMTLLDADGKLLSWGWIKKGYVEHSGLREYLKDGKVVLPHKTVEPSLFLALQHFDAFVLEEKKLDISFESLIELAQFAKEQRIHSLRNGIILLIHLLKEHNPTEECTQFLEKLPQREQLRITEDEKKEYMLSLIEREYGETTGTQSRWFNEKDPFESIARFTGRCCTLPPEEQHRFITTLFHFFTTAAYHENYIPIPKQYKERFALIDLPFLLKTIQASRGEKERLIYIIEMVTHTEFRTKIPLKLVESTYGDVNASRNRQRGWISGTPSKPGEAHWHPIQTSALLDSKTLNPKQKARGAIKHLFNLYFEHSIERDRLEPTIDTYCTSKDDTIREEVHTQLGRHLNYPIVKKLLAKHEIKELHVDPSQLSEEQLEAVFYHNLNANRFSISDMVKATFLWKPNVEMMQRVLEKNTHLKKGFQEYCREAFRAQAPKLDKLLRDLIEYPAIYASEHKRDKLFAEKVKEEYLTRAEIKHAYAVLCREPVRALFDCVGLTEVRQWMEELLTQHPAIFCEMQAQKIIEQAPPNLKDHLEQCLHLVLEYEHKSELTYRPVNPQKAHPLSDEEIVAIHTFLNSLENDKPARLFDWLYGVGAVRVFFPLVQVAKKHLSEKSMLLLSKLLEKPKEGLGSSHWDRKNQLDTIEQLFILDEIGEAELHELRTLLDSEEVKALFTDEEQTYQLEVIAFHRKVVETYLEGKKLAKQFMQEVEGFKFDAGSPSEIMIHARFIVTLLLGSKCIRTSPPGRGEGWRNYNQIPEKDLVAMAALFTEKKAEVNEWVQTHLAESSEYFANSVQIIA